MRILLVEDEKRVASFIARGLKEEGLAVDHAAEAEKALYLAQIHPYDVIILDVMLPSKDGLTLCKEFREKKIQAPILMLTAKSSVKDKVQGLNAGADDYLAKPFEFEELIARIRALGRRQTGAGRTLLQVADLTLNQMTHQVQRGGKEINLTSKEYALLQYLMLHSNQVVTRTMISEHVWNESFDTLTNVIDVYINYLRKKIDEGFKISLIHTLRGTGYILKDKNA